MIKSNNINPSSRYFAASNSAKGFKSYFNEIFYSDNIKRRYIIKGGPGTGKSSFMKFLGAAAEKKGKDVEYYYCSSDTDSLDGVVIDRRIAVLDGTAPHSCETLFPGAVDEIVNLGAFWSADKLSKKADEIAELSAEKKSCYARAYRYLAAARECRASIDLIADECRNSPKMMAAVGRMSDRFTRGKKAEIIPSCISAIGVHGRKRLDSFERRASKLYLISDCYGNASLYLKALTQELLKKERSLRIAYDPIDSERIEAVFLEDSGECFSIDSEDFTDEAYAKINMKRFIYSDRASAIRGRYRSGEKVYEALIELAEKELSMSGSVHFELEKIYVSSMDFEALNAFFDTMSEKIIN